MIRIKRIREAYDLLTERSAPFNNIEDKFKNHDSRLYEFGLTYPSYYDIMFNLHTPKYLDYVGTDIEPLAHTEKQKRLKVSCSFYGNPSAFTFPGKERKIGSFFIISDC